MTGTNLVAEFTRDLEDNILRLVDNEDIASTLLESIDNIKGSLKDIVNTNSFMYILYYFFCYELCDLFSFSLVHYTQAYDDSSSARLHQS